MSYYLNFNGTLFLEPPAGQWYNLSTGRKITKVPKECPGFLLHPSPRVAGTQIMIDRFLSIQTGNIMGSSPSCSSDTRSQFSLTSLPTSVSTTDVEKLTPEQINAVPKFTLAGLTTKARVTRVVDGDTLELLFHVSLERLLVLKLDHSMSGGFFTKWTTRITEYDAAEMSTREGIVAKEVMEQKIRELNNIVYIRIIKFDPHGRVLADVYEDPHLTKHIKDVLLNYVHPELGHVAVVYKTKRN